MMEFGTCTLPVIMVKRGCKMKMYKGFRRDLIITVALIILLLIISRYF